MISSSNRSLFVDFVKMPSCGGCFKIPASDRRPISGLSDFRASGQGLFFQTGELCLENQRNYSPQKDLSVRRLPRHDKSRNPLRQQGRNKLFDGSRQEVVAVAYSNDDDSTMQAGGSEIRASLWSIPTAETVDSCGCEIYSRYEVGGENVGERRLAGKHTRLFLA